MSAFGVPVVPGIARPGLTDDELIAAADEIGYPVLVKPSAGGGGKGMRMVERPADLPAALISARRESAAAFGDDTLFLERFVLRAQAYRGSGAGRHLRQRGALRRAGVQPAAPTPEGHRGGAVTAAGPRDARPDRCRRVRYRPQRGLHRRRHGRVHRLGRPPRGVLLHGDEHPATGRAPGHRAGDGMGSGRMASPDRGGGEADHRSG